MRLSKKDYMTDEILEMKEQIKVREKEERERAIVRNLISKLSDNRKQVMLKELTLMFATK